MYQGQPQQPLPGAYYGPAVPPPPQHSKDRSCCCCLFSTTVKIIIGLIILLGVLALVLWLVLRPVDIKAYVTTASLARFNLTTPGNNGNNQLEYNLTAVVAIRNPNKRVGVYYDWLEAGAWYEGERFAWKPLPTFYQGHKNTTTLYLDITGSGPVYGLSSSDLRDYEQQRQAGTFFVALSLRGRIRFKVGSLKTSRTTMRVRCFMPMPYDATGATVRTFSGTKCDVDL